LTLLKQILAILLFAGILFQTFNKELVIANYYLNKDYIAKNLCENRDKPQMHCNGKCHLCKQLNKTENNNQKSGIVKDVTVEYFATPYFSFTIPAYNITDEQQQYLFAPQTYSFQFAPSILRPPIV